MRLRLIMLVLLSAIFAWGCGEDAVATGGGGGGGTGDAIIVVRHTLARAITANITDLRFSGFDSANTLVFGPVTRPKAAEIRLAVPTSMTKFQIEYLQGPTVVGIFTINVSLVAGQVFEINDPAWIDVSGLLSLALTPADSTAPTGLTVQFTATGSFSDGSTQDLTTAVAWASSNPAAATIDPITGVATAVAAGNTVITASLNGISGNTALNVSAAALATLAVTPAPLNMGSGTRQQLTAIGTLTDGSVVDLTNLVNWASTNPAVVQVSASGLASAVGPGTSTVTATSGTVTGSTDATVSATGVVDFVATRALVMGSAANFCLGVATGDFDGDGVQDIVSANSVSVGIRLSSNQAVNSTPIPGLGLPPLPNAVVTGLFNADNVPDVALLGGANALVTFVGNADGSLTSPTQTPCLSIILRSGDVNGDGRVDLVGSDNGTNLETFLSNGDGTFGAPIVFGLTANADDFDVADLNGDGLADLALCDNTGAVLVQLGNGNGTFGAPTPITLAAGDAPLEVLLRDLNNDGNQDLLVDLLTATPVARLEVRYGNGNGTFQAALLGISGIGLPVPHNGVGVGDLNGDNRLDLVAIQPDVLADGGYQVALANADGTYASASLFAYSTPPGAPVIHIPIANLDARAGNDILLPLPATQASVTLTSGNGDGTLRTFRMEPGGPVVGAGARLADLNGDGRLDLLETDLVGLSKVSLTDATGQSGSVTDLTTFPVLFENWATGDLNGDGRIDVVAADNGGTCLVVLNTGSFPSSSFNLLNFPAAGLSNVSLADLNGDGALDLVVTDAAGLESRLSNGDGTFQATTNTSAAPAAQLDAFGLADFDGNGNLDAAIYDGATGTFNLLPGQGDGTFGAALPQAMGAAGTFGALGDFNGDGFTDLVHLADPQVEVRLGNGDGTFQATVSSAVIGGVTVGALGDYNSDGNLDVACNTPAMLQLALGNGDGTFAAVSQTYHTSLINNVVRIRSGDVDGDGLIDIVTVGSFPFNNIRRFLHG